VRRYGNEGGSGQGGAGGVGGRFRRIVGDPGNILSWSLPLYRLWGIQVRLHLFFIIFALGQMFVLGVQQGLLMLVSLFGLVLLHEYGHVFACRAVRGDADEIMLWPLGGLAYCNPPHEWKANLITTLGGPAVNVALLPVLGGVVLAMTGRWDAVFFDPFAPAAPSFDVVVHAVWWLHVVNAYLLGFNMLMPMYPMDAGRTLQNVLWGRIGYRPAQEIAVNVGFVAAIIVGAIGLFSKETMLIAIAFFCGFTCWMEKQRLKFGADVYGGGGEDYSDVGYNAALREQQESQKARHDGPSKAQLKRQKREAAEQAELDRILDRIAHEGMGALSRRERNFLQRTSARKRKSG
jgi:stage IV sporulation protein FB